jgi:hypothetical protein
MLEAARLLGEKNWRKKLERLIHGLLVWAIEKERSIRATSSTISRLLRDAMRPAVAGLYNGPAHHHGFCNLCERCRFFVFCFVFWFPKILK